MISTATENYEDMSVTALRRLVRERGLANGAAVVSARKADLIGLLTGDISELLTPQADLADVLATALQGRLAGGLDEDRVIELIREHAPTPQETHHVTQINLPDRPAVEIAEHTHACYERVLRLAQIGLPVYLVGPAGTGKTTLASQIAKGLGRPFSFNSLSAGCSESHLLGRTLPDADGNWTYQPSPFVTAYETGGVHLFDEVDAADPNLMVIVNAALANGHLSLPFENRVIARHPDTVILCAANTFGNGASRQYVGRNALDAATLDRFAVSTVVVDYDLELERVLACDIVPHQAGFLLAWVHSVRHKIQTSGLRRIMSTRTLVNAAKRIVAGDSLDAILEDYFAGWSEDEKARVMPEEADDE